MERDERLQEVGRTTHEGEYAGLKNPGEGDPLAIVQNEDSMLQQIDWARFGEDLVKDPDDAVIVSLMKTGESALSVYANALGLAADVEGLAEAGRRVERIRGRARRIQAKTNA